MPQPMLDRSWEPNDRFLSSEADVAATLTEPFFTLLSLPAELRLLIYTNIFNTPQKLPLRRLKDVTYNQGEQTKTQNIRLFNNSILLTCKTIYTEALPVFYASQPFHYSTEHNGLSRPPAIPAESLKWIKHISIDITSRAGNQVDAILTPHVQNILTKCTNLATFTLHLLAAADQTSVTVKSLLPSLTQTSSTARALRALRSRIHRLTIVSQTPPSALLSFRRGILDDDGAWVCELFGEWPRLGLSPAQRKANEVWRPRPWGARRGAVVRFGYASGDKIAAFHVRGLSARKRVDGGWWRRVGGRGLGSWRR